MQPDCRNCHGFPILHTGSPNRRAVSRRTEPRSEWSRRGGRVLCKAGAIELDRLVAGLSLTAGGVIGVLVARIVG